jgi:hypothetical protein
MGKKHTRQIPVGNTMMSVDFKQLRKHKKVVAVLAHDLRNAVGNELEGLLYFLDAFQDAAEKALGDEGGKVVFGDK